MPHQNSRLLLTLFSVGLSLVLVLPAVLPRPMLAQSDGPSGNALSSLNTARVTFEPPQDGQPKDTVGGASRDGGVCFQDAKTSDPSVTPLIPDSQRGLTVADRPTFFVYVPQTSAQTGMFVLKDDSEDYYYQKTVNLPRTNGIVSFKLPAEAPALKIGKSYQWSFVMICGEAIRPDSPRVGGQIQRIEPNPALSKQLENLSPLERAAVYGRSGIWYDTITSLAQLRRSQPQNSAVMTNWAELLKSVGLEVIATKSLLQ